MYFVHLCRLLQTKGESVQTTSYFRRDRFERYCRASNSDWTSPAHTCVGPDGHTPHAKYSERLWSLSLLALPRIALHNLAVSSTVYATTLPLLLRHRGETHGMGTIGKMAFGKWLPVESVVLYIISDL